MTETEWLESSHAERLCAHSDARGLWTARKARLLACAFYRLLGYHLTPGDREVLRVAERMADGRAKWVQLRNVARDTGWVLRTFSNREPLTTADIADALRRYREVTVRSTPFGIEYPPDGSHAGLVRDVFGNPFRPVSFDPNWRTATAIRLAQVIYETRDFGAMPILADALQDTGCEHTDILDHCRGDSPHVRGCWVVDLVLGRA